MLSLAQKDIIFLGLSPPEHSRSLSQSPPHEGVSALDVFMQAEPFVGYMGCARVLQHRWVPSFPTQGMPISAILSMKVVSLE